MQKITMPLALFKGKKKKRVPLGMNRYRSAHYTEQSWAKREYHKIIKGKWLKDVSTPAKITITLFPWSKRRIDLDNWCVVHSKFFGDAIQECWIIEDDTCEFINNIEYIYGHVDKDNPRVEIQIN